MTRYFRLWLLTMLLVPTTVLADVGALYDKADSLYNQQQYDEARQVALEVLTEAKDSDDVADCTSLLALICVRQGEFGEAVKYAKRCNAIDIATGDPDNISSSLNTLAGIYMSMRQPEEAEKYILKAISYAQKADNPQRLAVLHGMASEVYHHLKQEERSLDYATKAYQMEQQLGRKDKMAIRQAERAAALIDLKRYDEARQALAEAIPGLRESGNKHSLGIACNQMGNMMHRQANDSAAVRYFNEALAIFVAQHDLFNEATSRKGLYQALRKSDPALAMQHNDRYNELRDSLYDEKTGELLSKYAAEYGADELQAEYDEMQHSQRLSIIIGVAAVLLLMALLAFGFWRSRRDRRRIQELIAEISQLRAQEPSENSIPTAEVSSITTSESESKTDSQSEPKTNPETETESETETEDHLFLMRLVKAVNDGLPTGHYGVDEIASELNMSTQTFRRRLMRVTGDSPKAFIFAIQMERAAKLLKMSPLMPIAQVAMRCGYEETTSFTRAFRKTFGVPPSQYKG